MASRSRSTGRERRCSGWVVGRRGDDAWLRAHRRGWWWRGSDSSSGRAEQSRAEPTGAEQEQGDGRAARGGRRGGRCAPALLSPRSLSLSLSDGDGQAPLCLFWALPPSGTVVVHCCLLLLLPPFSSSLLSPVPSRACVRLFPSARRGDLVLPILREAPRDTIHF